MTGGRLNEAALFLSQTQEQRISSFWFALVKENYTFFFFFLPLVEWNEKTNPAKVDLHLQKGEKQTN